MRSHLRLFDNFIKHKNRTVVSYARQLDSILEVTSNTSKPKLNNIQRPSALLYD